MQSVSLTITFRDNACGKPNVTLQSLSQSYWCSMCCLLAVLLQRHCHRQSNWISSRTNAEQQLRSTHGGRRKTMRILQMKPQSVQKGHSHECVCRAFQGMEATKKLSSEMRTMRVLWQQLDDLHVQQHIQFASTASKIKHVSNKKTKEHSDARTP